MTDTLAVLCGLSALFSVSIWLFHIPVCPRTPNSYFCNFPPISRSHLHAEVPPGSIHLHVVIFIITSLGSRWTAHNPWSLEPLSLSLAAGFRVTLLLRDSVCVSPANGIWSISDLSVAFRYSLGVWGAKRRICFPPVSIETSRCWFRGAYRCLISTVSSLISLISAKLHENHIAVVPTYHPA